MPRAILSSDGKHFLVFFGGDDIVWLVGDSRLLIRASNSVVATINTKVSTNVNNPELIVEGCCLPSVRGMSDAARSTARTTSTPRWLRVWAAEESLVEAMADARRLFRRSCVNL
jgi:hypothetical protein